jgi:hypothetical protein
MVKARPLLREAIAAVATGALFVATASAFLLTFMTVSLWWTESRHHHSFILGTLYGATLAISLLVLTAALIVDRLRWSYRIAIVAPAAYAACLAAYCFTLDRNLVSWSDVAVWTLPLLCLIVWGLFRTLFSLRRQTI